MNIALVTDGIHPFVVGGMQRHSGYLARFLVERGVRVVLVHAVHSRNLPSDDEVFEALGLEPSEHLTIITLRFPSMGSMPGHYLRESYAYSMAAFKALKPHLATVDLIYAKGLSAWEFAQRRRKGDKLPPLAVKFHGYEMFQNIPGLKNWFARLLLKGPVRFINQNADFVFSYGGKISDIVRSLGVSPQRIIDVPTGIASEWLNAPHQPEASPRRFLFIGRYERRKGVEELSSVLRSIAPEAKFTFDFIGPVPFSKRISDQRITYHGQLTDTTKIRALIDQSDVLVTPSHAEGMPNVIMEGMARGLAVIATDTGAVRTLVDNTNGWLIEPGNATELKSAIEAAIAQRVDQLSNMQHASYHRVAHSLTWEGVIEKTIAHFASIISDHGA